MRKIKIIVILLKYLKEILLQLILCSFEIHVLKSPKLKIDQNNQYISIEKYKIKDQHLNSLRKFAKETKKIDINKINV